MRFVYNLLFTLALANVAHASAILNGSFETTDYFVGYGCGDIGHCYFGNTAFPHGPNAFSPWVFAGDSGVALVGSLVHEPGPQNGDQYAYLTSQAHISQTFVAPIGGLWSLTFYLADRTDCCSSGEGLSVTIDNNPIFTLANNSVLQQQGWKQFTVDFALPGSGSHTLDFAGSGAGPVSVLLDNVSATALPEPAPFFLVGLALSIPILFKKRLTY